MRRACENRTAGSWNAANAIDRVVLDAHERHRRPIALTGEGGTAFLLDLPQATPLKDGDGLVLEDGAIVRVAGKAEPLREIRDASTPRARPPRLAHRQSPRRGAGGGRHVAHPARPRAGRHAARPRRAAHVARGAIRPGAWCLWTRKQPRPWALNDRVAAPRAARAPAAWFTAPDLPRSLPPERESSSNRAPARAWPRGKRLGMSRAGTSARAAAPRRTRAA